jgi:glycerophosphoryl diester phosphodiesterase
VFNPSGAEAAVRIAEERGAISRLWLTYWHLPALREWRRLWPDVPLVYAGTPLLPGRTERLLSSLADIGVDAFNVHGRFCRASVVDRAHAHGLLLFVWGIRGQRQLERALSLGVDGVYCDDVPGMVETLRAALAQR